MILSGTDTSARGAYARPAFFKVFPRTRLFARFDKALERAMLWINAPAGAGKTVAVSSYLASRGLPALWYLLDRRDEDPAHFFLSLGLAAHSITADEGVRLPLLTPEYTAYLEVFARNYFDALFRRLPSPCVIVLDNYHEVAPGAPLHEALESAADRVPAGIHLIVISREDPPPAFVRLRAYDDLSVVGWDQMRLSPEEAQGLADLRRGQAVFPDFVAECSERAQGWAAGLVLLLDYAQTDGEAAIVAKGGENGLLFDYFAAEIFGRLPAETQTVLLQTVWLPRATPFLVEALTENPGAIGMLADLHRHGFFVARREDPEPAYEFHSLFRDFLLARAQQVFNASEMIRLQARAARVLDDAGSQEEAVPFYLSLGDWPALTKAIRYLGPTLLMQGRHQTLASWLESVPDPILQTDPWLLYYRGSARLPLNPGGARGYYEQAYARFDERDDAAGLYLAWCAVVDSYFLEWHDFSGLGAWVEAYAGIKARHPEFPSPEIEMRAHIMLLALLLSHPQHPDLPAWVESARKLLESGAGGTHGVFLACSLMHYYHWSADLVASESVLHLVQDRFGGRADGLIMVPMFDAYRAMLHWLRGNGLECLRLVRDGLRRADACGIHPADLMFYTHGVCGSLVMGDLPQAQELLDHYRAVLRSDRYLDTSLYHFMTGLVKAQNDEWFMAMEHFTSTINFARQAGTLFPEVMGRGALTRALFQTGRELEAEAELIAVLKLAKEIRSTHLECEVSLTEAYVCLANGKRTRGLAALAHGLALSRHCGGLVAGGWWGPEANTRLYTAALEAGIEVPYVRGLIRRLGLRPPDPGTAPDAWPWPIRIHTLGRFEILLNDEALRWSGKAQRKPLDLLKALIAFGGRAVPEAKLCDAVWPEADGDAAHRDFASALYRLRRLLGSEKALRVENSCVSLEPSLVWLDTWSLEAYLPAQSPLRGDQQVSPAAALARYHGEFLPEESAAWVLVPRVRLLSRLRRAAEPYGQYLESEGRQAEAVDWYLKILEVDPLAESVYSRLMQCYERMGYRAEALALYERCSQLFLSHFGIQPSPELQALKHRLLQLAKADSNDPLQR